ncbi:5-Methylcytosine G/T mismatch-specific DNA glycosylase [Cladophialophora carrionii]|uniref:5-Methylcytosine G/T mismatch-specific DNA glycosylase n=1 Tax=Cladophialophora carrionii TaxID=86049 RepID=A0A1C1CDJ6_9EURO|nr:5-Methylcytosine G/T mismatch-specific DNA glycosylase [Cladophialophora carrionii]
MSSKHGGPSPPPSPFSRLELPVVPTDDLGMVADDDNSRETAEAQPALKVIRERKAAGTRRKITYISRHFPTEKPKNDQQEVLPQKEDQQGGSKLKSNDASSVHQDDPSKTSTLPVIPGRPRIYYGLNIDELSSDSSLTDVPEDIGPDPFPPDVTLARFTTLVQAIKVKTKKVRVPTKSPYFVAAHKHRPTFLSTLPFPPLSHANFGLMQERLAHDPFRLLIATIFLNKTPGERAMPVFYQLMSRYPTPTDLANAEVSDVTSIIYELGFQNQRARKCVAMSKVWLEKPPERGKRYKKQNYPLKGDGRDVGNGEVLDDNDGRVAWEISHLPGLGPYSHDSWRMFCRDKLRNLAKNWNGEGAENPASFEPEWKRVVPLDKELRAWLTWMWLKEGWVWNKETGARTKASEELMSMASGGGIVVEEKDSDHLTVKTVAGDDLRSLKAQKKVESTAGDFLPGVSDTGRREVR